MDKHTLHHNRYAQWVKSVLCRSDINHRGLRTPSLSYLKPYILLWRLSQRVSFMPKKKAQNKNSTAEIPNNPPWKWGQTKIKSQLSFILSFLSEEFSSWKHLNDISRPSLNLPWTLTKRTFWTDVKAYDTYPGCGFTDTYSFLRVFQQRLTLHPPPKKSTKLHKTWLCLLKFGEFSPVQHL